MRIASTAAIAFQLAFALTLKNENALCHGFALNTPSTPRTTTIPQQAHARRTHTYEQDSATIFSQMDKDGNGKIDAKELRDYLVEKGPYTDAVVRSIFERLDVNRDGHLVLEELEDGMKQHQLLRATTTADPQTKFPIKPKKQQAKRNNNKKVKTQKLRDQAKQFFEMLDVNHNGYISLTELKEHFMVRRMQQVAQSSGLLFEKGRKQHTVSVQHSEAAIQQLFQTMDVNHDGRITLQDLGEAFVKYPSVRHAFQV